LNSIKCGEFLDQLSLLLASQEGFCFMELVNNNEITMTYKCAIRHYWIKDSILYPYITSKAVDEGASLFIANYMLFLLELPCEDSGSLSY
jgi:hypothetical protein